VRDEFGRVELPGPGRLIPKYYDAARVERVLWKVIRGLFFLESGRVLPEGQLHELEIVEPLRAATRLPSHPWFSCVRDTASMATYCDVFDYKAVGSIGPARVHAWALLLWDRICVLSRFHDPSCPCAECRPVVSDASQEL
jgi:hypothetical protein